jgi:hypothetical protein
MPNGIVSAELQIEMTVPKQFSAAWLAVGGLSTPSKMPCFSYSIPADACKTGGKLRNTKGSTCSKCYAHKGMYGWPNVVNALAVRLKKIESAEWVENMVQLIAGMESSGYFRWHDSGDIQSVKHLSRICEIARKLPKYKFWLPTREFSLVAEYCKNNAVPKNLNIRLSAHMIDGPAPKEIAARLGLTTSTVVSDESNVTCPSSQQNNQCLLCRKCWSKKVSNVAYHVH